MGVREGEVRSDLEAGSCGKWGEGGKILGVCVGGICQEQGLLLPPFHDSDWLLFPRRWGCGGGGQSGLPHWAGPPTPQAQAPMLLPQKDPSSSGQAPAPVCEQPVGGSSAPPCSTGGRAHVAVGALGVRGRTP